MAFTPGDKVIYVHPDTGRSMAGVIHGVRKVDDGNGDRILSYLIDTGKDVYAHEWETDQRDDEINKRFNETLPKDYTPEQFAKILESVKNQLDLPKAKKIKHAIRQPELIDVMPGDVKAA